MEQNLLIAVTSPQSLEIQSENLNFISHSSNAGSGKKLR